MPPDVLYVTISPSFSLLGMVLLERTGPPSLSYRAPQPQVVANCHITKIGAAIKTTLCKITPNLPKLGPTTTEMIYPAQPPAFLGPASQ